MGLIARLLDSVIAIKGSTSSRDVKCDTGGGNNIQAEGFGPPGDDSAPLADDYLAVLSVRGTGRGAVVGYVDGSNAPTAGPGEKKIYSRDPATGGQVASLHLGNEGTVNLVTPSAEVVVSAAGAVSISNSAGATIIARADGHVEINGLVISPLGSISTSGTISGNLITDTAVPGGVRLSTHVHASPGLPPTPGT